MFCFLYFRCVKENTEILEELVKLRHEVCISIEYIFVYYVKSVFIKSIFMLYNLSISRIILTLYEHVGNVYLGSVKTFSYFVETLLFQIMVNYTNLIIIFLKF